MTNIKLILSNTVNIILLKVTFGLPHFIFNYWTGPHTI